MATQRLRGLDNFEQLLREEGREPTPEVLRAAILADIADSLRDVVAELHDINVAIGEGLLDTPRR